MEVQIRKAVIKNTDNKWGWRGGDRTLTYCWWKCKLVTTTTEVSMKFPLKPRNKTTMLPSYTTPWYLSQRIKVNMQ